MAAAWTGRQLVVWGGQAGDGHQAAADGAAYDPAMDRWEELPASPIAGRFGASAVWTGREVLFWGGQGQPDTLFPDGASYDPATRRWEMVPPAPIGARTNHQAAWTGTEMVVWGGFRRCCPIDSVIHDPAAAAYDPVSDKWRRIADVPPGARPDALPSDPVLPTSTADPIALGVSSDHEVFTWTGKSGELQGLARRSSDGSSRRTAALHGQAGASIAVGGPGRIYAAPGQSARVLEYRIADDRWEELPLPPISTRSAAVLAWTGSELLFWGGIGDEGPEMDGAAWRPAG
jgi:N-acetylneuraminic acid mutarotase